MGKNLKPRRPPDADDYVAMDDREEKRHPDKKKAKTVKDDYFDLDDPVDEEEEESAETPVRIKRHDKKTKKGVESVVVVKPRVRRLLGGERKLTKKNKADLAEWRGANHGRALDKYFARQAAEARKKFGHNSVLVGCEAQNLLVGIPCPALAFEFLIALDAFPLGLVIQLVAKHGVGKSGLVAEFGKWFDAAGGGTDLQENETKFSSDWYESIMGEEAYKRMLLKRCTSVEDWQRKLTYALRTHKEGMTGTEKEPGPGRTFPVMFAVDSIMGKMSEETQEKILGKKNKKTGERGTGGEGAAGRNFPLEALSITSYMKSIPQELDDWPFALVLVNHLKMKASQDGQEERSTSGGKQVNFQESFELELSKPGHKARIESADFEGFPVSLSCEKNSFGPTHRKIRSRVLWWEEQNDDGDWKQKTKWDWDWSTVDLLNGLMHGERASPRFRKNLKDVDFHLNCPSTAVIENTAWSASLGMKAKDAVSWAELGKMIRKDADLMDRLRAALRIKRVPLLDGDYLSIREKQAESMP